MGEKGGTLRTRKEKILSRLRHPEEGKGSRTIDRQDKGITGDNLRKMCTYPLAILGPGVGSTGLC